MANPAIEVLGVDLGKNSCSVAGLDSAGAVVMRCRKTRAGLIKFVSQLPPCIVAIWAFYGAHFLAQIFQSHGHSIWLMPPEYLQLYVKAQKTDDWDAEAIAKAAARATMRLVTPKGEAQLDLQILHRARARLVAERTRLTNELRIT
jgi:transposase